MLKRYFLTLFFTTCLVFNNQLKCDYGTTLITTSVASFVLGALGGKYDHGFVPVVLSCGVSLYTIKNSKSFNLLYKKASTSNGAISMPGVMMMFGLNSVVAVASAMFGYASTSSEEK